MSAVKQTDFGMKLVFFNNCFEDDFSKGIHSITICRYTAYCHEYHLQRKYGKWPGTHLQHLSTLVQGMTIWMEVSWQAIQLQMPSLPSRPSTAGDKCNSLYL